MNLTTAPLRTVTFWTILTASVVGLTFVEGFGVTLVLGAELGYLVAARHDVNLPVRHSAFWIDVALWAVVFLAFNVSPLVSLAFGLTSAFFISPVSEMSRRREAGNTIA